MGYHVIDPASVPRTPDYPCVRRSISDEGNLATLAAAVYELAPGEQLARTYHYHEQREELFAVRSGTLFVETPEGTHEVPADQLFVAEPGNPHRAYNPESSAEPVRVLGVGAPQYDVAKPYDPEEPDADGANVD